MVTEVTRYQTNDGLLFDTLKEAQEHEQVQGVVDEIGDFLHNNSFLSWDECVEAVTTLLSEYDIKLKEGN